jgi:hypothetical protein
MNCILADEKVDNKVKGGALANSSNLNFAGTSSCPVSVRDQLSKGYNTDLASVDKEIHVLPTHQTPEFIFSYEGIIKIKGRGLYCNKPELADQMICWIERYLNSPAKTTYVTLGFEYLNSLSMSVLVSILSKLSQIVLQSKKLVVKWYYEVDDDNILDRGRYISSCCDIPIEFIMTNNITRL